MHLAVLIGIGSELLGSARLDTNSLRITSCLARYGVQVVEKRVIGDDIDRISAALRALLGKVGLVVMTGGLGPTADDVTREAAAAAVGRPLEHDAEVEGWIRERYHALQRSVPEMCRAMAQVIPGARMLPNTRGTAPGMMLEAEGTLLVLLPGVPTEMELMLTRDLEPELERRCGRMRRLSRTLLLGGVFESDTEARITGAGIYSRFGRDNVSILASYGVLRLVLAAAGSEEEAVARLDEMEAAFREVLGDDVAGVDVDSLAQVVLASLTAEGQTLATAESCTGGLVSAWLTEVPGSSAAFCGGAATYSNDAKEDLVAVPHTMLLQHGAVSEPVARAMASGVRERFAADWGIGITGIAGPSGGTEDKPVGLVYWAVAGPDGVQAQHRVFQGSRKIVRQWSGNSALDLLRRSLPSGRSS